jgi:hypothetical protein
MENQKAVNLFEFKRMFDHTTRHSGNISYKWVDKNIYGDFLISFGQKIVFHASDRLLGKFSGKT